MNFKKIKKYRRIFYLLAIILAIVILSAVHRKYVNTLCADIKVVVLDSSQARFITQNTVIDYLTRTYKKNIIGNTFKNINLYDIESDLKDNPFIKKAEVFRNNNDMLEIQIQQRQALLRIFDKKNNTYYIDNEGNFMPTSSNFAPYVPIFSGNIPAIETTRKHKLLNIEDTTLKNNIYSKCFQMAKELKRNHFTYELIDQVVVNPQKEFELIPKIGNFKIIFGSLNDAEKKIRNLEAFYKQVGPKIGWNKYSKINLEYTNQIVCTIK